MALTKETEDYIAGWKQHVASCLNEGDVDVMFDKFRALFQIYNRLYNEVSLRLGEKQTDRKGATSHVVQYLTPDALVASIEGTEKAREAELQLRDFVRQHTYHFVLVGEQYEPSNKEDGELLKKMQSADNRVRMEGLLLLIYNVRCNLFHGQKHLHQRQLPLMRAVIPILELIVSNTEEKLRA